MVVEPSALDLALNHIAFLLEKERKKASIGRLYK